MEAEFLAEPCVTHGKPQVEVGDIGMCDEHNSRPVQHRSRIKIKRRGNGFPRHLEKLGPDSECARRDASEHVPSSGVRPLGAALGTGRSHPVTGCETRVTQLARSR